MRIRALAVVVSVFCFKASASLTPYLSSEVTHRLQSLLSAPPENLAAAEKEFQTLVSPQIWQDLKSLYSEENRSKVLVTFSDFTREGGKPGKDGGYGLHVTRRLIIEDKVIDVNEHWPEDRSTGALYLPDEIRVKTLAFSGERHVPGSEKLYLFDAFRIAWKGATEAKIARRTRYRPEGGMHSMRVKISAPYSCTGCHRSELNLSEDYLGAGEKRDYEAIVPTSYFSHALDRTLGFLRYQDLINELYGEKSNLAALREKFFPPPAWQEALARAVKGETPVWLGSDERLSDDVSKVVLSQQGVYENRTGLWREALEKVYPGKYDIWEPVLWVKPWKK